MIVVPRGAGAMPPPPRLRWAAICEGARKGAMSIRDMPRKAGIKPGRKARRRSLYAVFISGSERSHGAFTGLAPSFLASSSRNGWTNMLDLLLLALGLGAFALLAAYAAGCERV